MLEAKYRATVEDLYATDEYRAKAWQAIEECLGFIRSFSKPIFTLFEEKEILAQGELMSTALMINYLHERGINAAMLPALEFMRTDKNAEPDMQYITDKINELLQENSDADLYITQGYICKNAYGETDNLQRGGSDYTASLIGAAVKAEEIEI